LTTNIKIKDVHRKIMEITKSLPSGKLLDIPCGSGVLSKHFEELGFDVHKADINPHQLKINNKNFKKIDLNELIDYENDTFDYCLCIEGIEHTFNPDNVIKELSRVLKPSGILYLSTPNVCRLKNRLHYFFTGINDILEPAPLPVEVPHHYGLHVMSIPFPQLDYFLRRHNFQILQIYAVKYHRKSRFVSMFLRPLLKAKMNKSYKKCRDRYAEIVVKRLLSFMLSGEILNGETLVVKAKKFKSYCQLFS
jgi:2-polyprenyl-3-methyl-5-hydroxy-6-metoxy-1,4-benzoquinol methylase